MTSIPKSSTKLPEKVIGVQFGILSPQEIRARSVAEITTHETYEGNEPKIGGLFDPRMGVLEPGKVCPVDGKRQKDCPGYFGHHELAMPVFHMQFFKYTLMSARCVCWRCSNLLIDLPTENEDDSPLRLKLQTANTKLKGFNRFNQVYSLCRQVKVCGDSNNNGCGAIQPDFIRRDPKSPSGKVSLEWKANKAEKREESQVIWYAEDCLKVLRRISDEHCELMGFNPKFCRPDWLISEVIAVSPPSVRPSVRADNNSRMLDDLTHKYCDIIKTNRTLKSKLQNPNPSRKVIDDWYYMLQYHVATLVNSSVPGLPPAKQRSGRPLLSIVERLKTKQGLVRGNLMGKRVDQSARSVITPDARIGIGELGVPIAVAKTLTKPEIVGPRNYHKLLEYVRNGYDKWPGAKMIKRNRDGRTVSLRVLDGSSVELEMGDVVHRHLMDGDFLLFNRQPTLHKPSMMAHKVRVLPGNTFRLNSNVTTPYNADFDGDEMNAHLPQSKQTEVELRELCAVKKQIISPGTGAPIIACVQDSLLGCYLLTRSDTYLNREEFLFCMSMVEGFNGILPPPTIPAGEETPESFPRELYNTNQDLWSGRDVFSMILPNIYYTRKNNGHTGDPIDDVVKIEAGRLVSGILDKKIMGTKEQGLVHIIFNVLGDEAAEKFLNDTQSLIMQWMLISGFSVGASDLVPDKYAQEKMKEVIKQHRMKVVEILQNVHSGILENRGGQSNHDEMEVLIQKQLTDALTSAGDIGIKTLPPENRIVRMVKAGSKGSNINIGQMIACVGQQAVQGRRVQYGYTDRTLPHFPKYDDGPAGRGFVENSFIQGLTPHEFFFHAMTGREGLIDTAVKTADTGYIQRRLIKAMEDLRVAADGTVRNAQNQIVQFAFANDGFDPTRVEKQKLPSLEMSVEELINQHDMNGFDWSLILKPDIAESIESSKEVKKHLDEYVQKLIDDRSYILDEISKGNPDILFQFPIQFKRVITDTKAIFGDTPSISNLHPAEILKAIDELCDLLKPSTWMQSYRIGEALIRYWLSPRKLYQEMDLSVNAFGHLIDIISRLIQQSYAQVGELVGTVAAQSIGEPATQMTLNTFHLAGVAAKSAVTRGVPRFRELLNLTKDIKSPAMTVYLHPDVASSKERALQIKNILQRQTLKDIVKSTEIFFDPSGSQPSSFLKDDEFLESYRELAELETIPEGLERSPYVLRMEINRLSMAERGLRMIDIYTAIDKHFNEDKEMRLSVVFSDDNAEQLVVRVQLLVPPNDTETDMMLIMRSIQKTILHDLNIGGIQGINEVAMHKEDNVYRKLDNEPGNWTKLNEWVIDTIGSNMIEVLSHPAVDSYNTYSNNIHEVRDLLGLEAARALITEEIQLVFETSGAYVNPRHVSLLVDTMTSRGTLMSIDRHGINRSDRGPLMKCSFEETPDILFRAGVFGEYDSISGVSASIMMGQEVPIGTNAIGVKLDEEYMNELILNRPMVEEEIPEEEEEKEEADFHDAVCDNINIQLDIDDF